MTDHSSHQDPLIKHPLSNMRFNLQRRPCESPAAACDRSPAEWLWLPSGQCWRWQSPRWLPCLSRAGQILASCVDPPLGPHTSAAWHAWNLSQSTRQNTDKCGPATLTDLSTPEIKTPKCYILYQSCFFLFITYLGCLRAIPCPIWTRPPASYAGSSSAPWWMYPELI